MQVTLTFLCLLGAAAVMAAPGHDKMAPEVATMFGRVRGVTRTNDQGVQYSEYLGIPYAKPPTGSRRFARPEPADAWTGTRDASHFGASCPQPGYSGQGQMDEDCLFLNVYVSQAAADAGAVPVMVFIYGGGFLTGSSSAYSGGNLCGKGVIVVTINYRLGALGFLSTGDAVAPGNYGLLDQILALQWVKENIVAFQGDPNKVTIFGESAGAASVSLLLLSPLAKGLFHGVIAESGSSLAQWAVARSYSYPSQPAIALDLGSKVGCQATDHAALVACLRTKDAMALATAMVERDVAGGIAWRPVIETVYGVVPEDPFSALQKGSFHRVPVMSGTNENEAALIIRALPGINEGLPNLYFEAMVRDFMFTGFQDAAFVLIPRVLDLYTAGLNTSDPKAVRKAWIQLLTDWNYFVPSTWELLLLQSQDSQNPHYQYLFSHYPRTSTVPDWFGASHVMELPYVFGLTHKLNGILFQFNYTFNHDDYSVNDDVMEWWTNFAKHGSPSPLWPAFTEQKRDFLRIQRPTLLDTDLRREKFQFWSQEAPKVYAAVQAQSSTPPPTVPPAIPVVG